MDIAVIAVGSRGDVQPPAALAAELAERGHKVRLIAPAEFAGLLDGRLAEFCRLDGDMRAMMAKVVDGAQNPLSLLRDLIGGYREIAFRWTTQARDFARGADVLVGIGAASFGAATLGEALDVPFLHGFLLPVIPTGAVPSPAFPQTRVSLPGWMNRLEHAITMQLLWQLLRPLGNAMRRDLFGLARLSWRGPGAVLRASSGPVLIAASSAVIPPPQDWNGRAELTGYWFLDSLPGWSAPPNLTDFLQEGDPPVYIGFGSMTVENPEAVLHTILSAIERVGCRAVISAGWAGLRPQSLSGRLCTADDVPHAWLFPRMASIVHHGGAGTTAAALRAGRPSVVIPFFSDQPFWAYRLERLGVSAATIRRRQLTGERLATAIRLSLSSQPLRETAARLGAQIRAEDGPGRAALRIEELAKVARARLRSCPISIRTARAGA